MKLALPIDFDRLAAYCRANRITRLSVHGSVLGDDFRPASDVDMLMRFADDAHPSLFDVLRIQDDLTEIVGRRVDLDTERMRYKAGKPCCIRGIAAPHCLQRSRRR